MLASYRGKRFFDLIFSVIAIFVLSPLFLVVALLVMWFHGRPVFFVQKRPGLHGKPFNMIKFRSMTNARTNDGELLPAEMRVTALGNLMRRMSLDELPELFNVTTGDMSIVGPRPLLMQYLPLYTLEQMRRHNAVPGITGWAQINGRNNVSWDEKFCLDLWYVDNISFGVDMRIIGRTLLGVLNARDINKEGFEGMDTFQGEVSMVEPSLGSVAPACHRPNE